MKIATNYRLALCLCLMAAAADRAALASQPVPDGQEQAREMISGRPAVQAPQAKASRVADPRHGRREDPLESARRMILGSTPKVNSEVAAANSQCAAAQGSLIASRP
jgi:hypothetical protein